MADEKIEQLLEWIKSNTDGIKILGETDLDHVRHIIYGNDPLPHGCPSRASMAEFALRRLKGRLHEAGQLIEQLETEIYEKFTGK
ncbi:MAG TPA: hypothetical protein PKD24_13165 [Pyrinomonadaceae bacterium]|nr:hypothetical protein [Pyrinomonadaceae bacterium]HMP67084.1 hypothetical protein [Pyrinomonadaceae bacterium]